jgi:hypothetical protein
VNHSKAPQYAEIVELVNKSNLRHTWVGFRQNPKTGKKQIFQPGICLRWKGSRRARRYGNLSTTSLHTAIQNIPADRASALAEYMGEFRDDVAEFLPRSVIEKLVIGGRVENLPNAELRYSAFADLSGGRSDDAALAIAHRADKKVVIDFLKRYRPPFNPQEVVGMMAEEIKRFSLRRVTGDNYAAEWVTRAFDSCGVVYARAEKSKAALYAELLPRMCSGEVELLDHEVLVDQLASLERRTRSGGRDIIDHPTNGHDDLANAVAGVAEAVCTRRIRIGAF